MPVRTPTRSTPGSTGLARPLAQRRTRQLPVVPVLPGLLAAMLAAVLLTACSLRHSAGDAQLYTPPRPERVYHGPVPVRVLDRHLLASFAQRNPDAAQRTGLVVLPDGRAEPSGDIAPADYQPESYGLELALRLNLRSFPSLLAGFTDDARRTFAASRQWTVSALDRTSLDVHSPDLVNTLVVFATLDWNGNGVRDWLVLLTQRTLHDEGFYLGCWLVVEDPSPRGLLQARLLSLDEYRGMSRPVTRVNDKARAFLDQLLREQLLPASQEAARTASDEAALKAVQQK